ncbi:N-acetylmuramoyl-L-alanine amidase family protein [Paenibacillus silvae]|uniref:N-acetylmuramoyl-L-alanine amidase n=1 Tax=Paenibacillus silvae TaxID=1325358 RepID=A0A2W6PG63_9BACL|nr:N-acetylmuramoyl-L-alanine amidase family protein [Paenibacillus silvae]PZT57126.1 N-acetylmuramoyl-L-alanine amidase [Paenibacillus silvae]
MKKMASFLLFGLLFLLVLTDSGHAATASPQTKIILDGHELVLPSDVEVVNINKNVMIPIHVVAENLNFKVKWDQKKQNVSIEQNNKVISLHVGRTEAYGQNGKVTLNTAPQLIKNTVVVPLRFVSEEMGLSVSWNNKDKIVGLTSAAVPSVEPAPSLPPVVSGPGQSTVWSKVNDISFANHQLVVSIDHEVTPRITRLSNPDRIVVDLPDTTFGDMAPGMKQGTMGKLDVSGIPNVTEVRYSLFTNDPAQVRVVMELNNLSDVQVNVQYVSGKLIVDLAVTGIIGIPVSPAQQDNGKSIIVIDPGHGGKDPGTIGISKTQEKNFTLPLALKVQALLAQEPDIEVVMTRETDVYPTRPERVQLANTLNADVFVSIHGNSVEASPQISGTETFYYKRSSSKALADIMHRHLVEALGFKDRGVKNGNLEVLRDTTMPAVLLEIGFLSNLAEEQAMLSETVQDKAAQAIVDAIKEFLHQPS